METDDESVRRMTANKIRHIREGEGLTQAQFAKKVDLTQAAISQFEDGKRTPSTQALQKISRGLGMSIDGLLGIAISGSGDSEKDAALEAITSKLKILPKEKLFAIDRFLRSMIGG